MDAALGFRTERTAQTLVITLSAPRTRNALNRATRVALVDAFKEADADPEIRALIITGDDPSFSSGVDAKELFAAVDYVAPAIDPPTALRSLRTPSIAAVNGSCVSGGLEIALGCSMIIASERASFADTHAKIGISPGWGLSADLPAAVGIGRARQLTLTGMPIDAATALKWGLVNEVVEHDSLLQRAQELAAAIALVPEHAASNAMMLYARGQAAQLEASRGIERAITAEFAVDRDASRRGFGD
jgi:enoyl-CoA hydratase